jgi:hypothetical protein
MQEASGDACSPAANGWPPAQAGNAQGRVKVGERAALPSDLRKASEGVKNSTARELGCCNPSRIEVGARHGVPVQRFLHTFSGSPAQTDSLLPLGSAGTPRVLAEAKGLAEAEAIGKAEPFRRSGGRAVFRCYPSARRTEPIQGPLGFPQSRVGQAPPVQLGGRRLAVP